VVCVTEARFINKPGGGINPAVRRASFILIGLAILAIAGWLRFSDLDLRPAHHDESVNFEFMRNLAQGAGWSYDPQAYHGPMLYFAAVPVWIALGPENVGKFALRLIPALAGLMAVLLALCSRRVLKDSALLAAAFLALSADQVFYSRMFIHEVLMAATSVGLILSAAGAALERRPRSISAIPIWIALSLTIKETAVFMILSIMLAVHIEIWIAKRNNQWEVSPAKRAESIKAMTQGAFIGLIVWALLFTSVGTNPRGALDFFLAYIYWGNTAAEDHVKSFWYFLDMLNRYAWPLWLFSLPALIQAAQGDALRRFLAVVALSTVLIYSGIPYKTPWCMVQITTTLALLAAAGAADLWRWARRMYVVKAAVALAVAVGLTFMFLASLAMVKIQYTDNDDSLVYVQAEKDLELVMEDYLERVTAVTEQGSGTEILFVDDKHPIPFYLRKYTNVRYYSEPPEIADAPVWISSYEMLDAMRSNQWDFYQIEYFQTWPGQWNCMGVRLDLWNEAWGREPETFELLITPQEPAE